MEQGDEVFYSMRVTVTNQQYITQEIETESVTIRLPLKSGPQTNQKSETNCVAPETNYAAPETRNVSATLCIPARSEQESVTELRMSRKKRTVVRSSPEEEKRSRLGDISDLL